MPEIMDKYLVMLEMQELFVHHIEYCLLTLMILYSL